jgi:predicted DNA-binding antitoxin AbrB/MazE fold protein
MVQDDELVLNRHTGVALIASTDFLERIENQEINGVHKASPFSDLGIPVTILPERFSFLQGEPFMAITVEAVYENGVLKLSEPLPWKDGERVSVAISSLDSPILKAYGIMGFKGTAEEAEYLALHSDLLLEES